MNFLDNTVKKIGYMGGTFNPIHDGHIALAKAAKEYLELDEIWFVPTIPWMKAGTDVADAKLRLEMTKLALTEYEDFVVNSTEIDSGKSSYSYETMEKLGAEYPAYEFYFIMGADSLFSLEKWKEPGRFLASCHILAAVRDEEDAAAVSKQIAYLQEKYEASIFQLPMARIDISSTMIRDRVKNQEDISDLISSKEVREYIEANQLYR